MKILAFDTCLDKMYVAVGDENEVFCSKIVETTQKNYHSAYLISTITNLLEESKLSPQDIDVIATNIGPGSFTGIRACTTVARVMAQASENKTIGVSSLEILSKISDYTSLRGSSLEVGQNKSTEAISSKSQKTLVALDARKEMAYVSVFDAGREILAPQSILLEDLKEMIKSDDYFIVTDDKLEPIIGGVSYQKEPYPLGEFLLKIAADKLKDAEFDSRWQKLLPLYIQPPALHVKAANKPKQ